MPLNDLDLHDDAYRRHYDEQYGVLGDDYDDYAPAYRYGSRLADDARFRSTAWGSIEPMVRADWQERYPGDSWQRFKAAIRHGWERITQRD